MMKKCKIKKWIDLFLALFIILCGLFPMAAVANDDLPRKVEPIQKRDYNLICSAYARMEISGRKVFMKGLVVGNRKADKLRLQLSLQQKEDGIYKTIKTWEKFYYAGTGVNCQAKMYK